VNFDFNLIWTECVCVCVFFFGCGSPLIYRQWKNARGISVRSDMHSRMISTLVHENVYGDKNSCSCIKFLDISCASRSNYRVVIKCENKTNCRYASGCFCTSFCGAAEYWGTKLRAELPHCAHKISGYMQRLCKCSCFIHTYIFWCYDTCL